jgi:hypothetical protein
VAFHRGVAEVRSFGDLGVGQAPGYELDHVELARGQLPGRLGGRGVGTRSSAEVLDQVAGNRRGSRASPAATVRTAVATARTSPAWSRPFTPVTSGPTADLPPGTGAVIAAVALRAAVSGGTTGTLLGGDVRFRGRFGCAARRHPPLRPPFCGMSLARPALTRTGSPFLSQRSDRPWTVGRRTRTL